MNYLAANQNKEPNSSLKRVLIEAAKTSKFFFKSGSEQSPQLYRASYISKEFNMGDLGDLRPAPSHRSHAEDIKGLERQINNICLLNNIKPNTQIDICSSLDITIERRNTMLGVRDISNFIVLNISNANRYFINHMEYDKEQFYEYLGNNPQLDGLKNAFVAVEEKNLLSVEIPENIEETNKSGIKNKV